MEKEMIRSRLESLSPGAKVHIKLDDGSEVAGQFEGFDGEQVHVEGRDDVKLAQVSNVLMDVSSAGVE